MNASHKLKTATADSKSAAQNIATEVRSVGEEIWDDALEFKDTAVESVKEMGSMASKQARTIVKNHPGALIAAGVGIGLLAGFYIARR